MAMAMSSAKVVSNAVLATPPTAARVLALLARLVITLRVMVTSSVTFARQEPTPPLRRRRTVLRLAVLARTTVSVNSTRLIILILVSVVVARLALAVPTVNIPAARRSLVPTVDHATTLRTRPKPDVSVVTTTALKPTALPTRLLLARLGPVETTVFACKTVLTTSATAPA